MRVALCQINTTIGDFERNRDRVLTWASRAHEAGAELAVFPEMTLTGYPPGDLLERASFIERCREVMDEIIAETKRFGTMGLVVGTVRTNPDCGKPLFNEAWVVAGGGVVSTHAKTLLPFYDVFDEERHFEPAPGVQISPFAGQTLGVTICEDIWNDKQFWTGRRYRSDPIRDVTAAGARVLINLSASPFSWGKGRLRYEVLRAVAKDHNMPVAYVNLVGGNDSLVFDGRSLAIAADGTLLAVGAPFEEDLVVVDLPLQGAPVHASPEAERRLGFEEMEGIRCALTLGLRDYARKCGFRSAVLGLSGGIDSAVTAVLATEALGPENVLGAYMPTRFSSDLSRRQALELARGLGIGFKEIPIDDIFRAYLDNLAEGLDGLLGDSTEENIQARIRGNVLMALSNRFGHLVLATGNKSELAVGYCTLYGDMSGGLCVISDLYKTEVYRLAEHLNRDRIRIPLETIQRPPSAELKAGQVDQDTLPPYDRLDAVLRLYVDENYDPEAIVAEGFDPAMVGDIVRRVERNEYKRQQAAPGLRVSWKAFGMGRRIPIARRIRE